MLKFNEFRKKNLTLYEILDTMISNEILVEDVDDRETVVYKDHQTTQVARVSKHFTERNHRTWWASFQDPNFTNFAAMALRRLNGLFKVWMDVKRGIKKNDRVDKVYFSEREEFAFISKDRTKAWIVSLRPTDGMGNYCTSFCIMTVLNSDAADAKHSHKVDVFVQPNHELSLDNYEFISESIVIKGRTFHIIEI